MPGLNDDSVPTVLLPGYSVFASLATLHYLLGRVGYETLCRIERTNDLRYWEDGEVKIYRHTDENGERL